MLPPISAAVRRRHHYLRRSGQGHCPHNVEHFRNSLVTRMRGRTALPTLTLWMPSALGAPELHRNWRARAGNFRQPNRFCGRNRTSCRWSVSGSQHRDGGHDGGRHLVTRVRAMAAIGRDRDDRGRHTMQFGAVADLIVGRGIFTALRRTGYQICQAMDIIEERAAGLGDSSRPIPAKPVREMNIVEE